MPGSSTVGRVMEIVLYAARGGYRAVDAVGVLTWTKPLGTRVLRGTILGTRTASSFSPYSTSCLCSLIRWVFRKRFGLKTRGDTAFLKKINVGEKRVEKKKRGGGGGVSRYRTVVFEENSIDFTYVCVSVCVSHVVDLNSNRVPWVIYATVFVRQQWPNGHVEEHSRASGKRPENRTDRSIIRR